MKRSSKGKETREASSSAGTRTLFHPTLFSNRYANKARESSAGHRALHKREPNVAWATDGVQKRFTSKHSNKQAASGVRQSAKPAQSSLA